MRVALDTNVLVSAVLFPKSRIGTLVRLVRTGVLKQLTSPTILDELRGVLMSPKIGFEREKADEAVAAVREAAMLIRPTMVVDVVKEHDADNRILECALEGKAEFLVTGDLKHLRPLDPFRGIRIRTPREFMDQHFPPRTGLPKSSLGPRGAPRLDYSGISLR